MKKTIVISAMIIVVGLCAAAGTLIWYFENEKSTRREYELAKEVYVTNLDTQKMMRSRRSATETEKWTLDDQVQESRKRLAAAAAAAAMPGPDAIKMEFDRQN